MVNKKNGYSTLAEYHAQLKEEGKWDEYIAMKKRKEEDHRKLWEERRKEEAPIVSALRSAGIDVQSISELDSKNKSYACAIPILLEHAKRDYPEWLREDILRAMATPEARSYWSELVELLESDSLLPPSVRWLASLVLNAAADDSVADDVIRLASDRRLGVYRVVLIFTLQRLKSPRAKMLLLELRKDPDLGREVKKLRRLERLGLPFK